MTEYHIETFEFPISVGDILCGKKTDYPHLDAIGDVGRFSTKSGVSLAEYVVVRVYPTPRTNEVLYVDIQINKSLNEAKIIPNPEALCEIHSNPFPCPGCAELKKRNYG
jgi:hypothetical protein